MAAAQKLVRDGAHLLDVGGESTRPGSRAISAKEELSRIIPVIQILAKRIPVPISVDTYKPLVARHALDSGAGILNNIMGTKPDPALLKMVQRYDAAVILMHMRGNPRTMQKKIHYKNLLEEIKGELRIALEKCLEIGIKFDRIILDPGLGFGKAVSHNLELINRLGDFQALNRPILVGPSRKFFIGQVVDKDVSHRVMGTAAAVVCAILKGAHIVRLHDVEKLKDAIAMTDSVLNYESWKQ